MFYFLIFCHTCYVLRVWPGGALLSSSAFPSLSHSATCPPALPPIYISSAQHPPARRLMLPPPLHSTLAPPTTAFILLDSPFPAALHLQIRGVFLV